MKLDELKELIINTHRNGCFYFSAVSIDRIFSMAGNWQHDWTKVFKRILARIKKGHGVWDCANKEGKYVFLPTNSRNCMVIFFTPQLTGGYFIYDFKIVSLYHKMHQKIQLEASVSINDSLPLYDETKDYVERWEKLH